MKKIIGNGAGTTILTGAINPGSSLAIESASLTDVNVFGGTLFVPGGVVLNGVATTSGTAAVAFTGGTFGTGAYISGTMAVSSAVIMTQQNVAPAEKRNYLGVDDGVMDLNGNNIRISSGGIVNTSGVSFQNGSATNTGVFYISGGTASFSNCAFLNNSAMTSGIFWQTNNAARLNFESCVFSGNSVTSNNGILYKTNLGNTRFAHCSFTGNQGRYIIMIQNAGGYIEVVNCTFTNNNATGTGQMLQITGSSAYFESCTFSSNTCNNKAGRIFLFNSNVTLSDCVVEQIMSSTYTTILGSAACVLNITGGTYGGITCSGTTNLNSNLNLEYISSGTVNIASGTSISLTKNIKAAINVDGGCTVNGAVVSAGTYTSIDSNGTAT